MMYDDESVLVSNTGMLLSVQDHATWLLGSEYYQYIIMYVAINMEIDDEVFYLTLLSDFMLR